MSRTIDERVLEMRFDNKNFEKNVQGTMSSLDKLKQKLNLTGASKGLENIDTNAKKINFSGLSNAVDTVSTKFSALQVIGVTALANITNSAVNAGKRIASALTIEPIKTGFQEYETQINSVQTILANTQHKGTNLDDVNKALDELNTYADKTIYNFTEMTRNIGTFTAAGVDLETSVGSIKGIANLAAVSGSTSQQASTAMYQLSQALAAGKVSLMDWNSVVNAGMGGEVFQNALKRTAENMGKDVDGMIEKYGSFRESLTKGEWLTSDVLTKTLEQFTMAAEEGSEAWNNYKKSLMDEGYTEAQAIEILKMANTATDAATKVKTFTQLWDTLKESAQSGWTQTWEILVGDFEEAKELLTGISNVVGDFIGKSAEARNSLLQGWKDSGGRTATIDALKNAFEGITNIVKPIREAFREIFPPMTVEQLMNFSNKLQELTGNFADFTERHGPQIKSTFKGIFAVLDIVATIISKVAGGIFDITGSILGFSGGILAGTATLGDWLSNLRDSIKESDIFGKAIDKIVNFLQNGINKIKEFGSSLKEGFKSDGYEGFVGFLKAVWEFVSKIGSGISTAFGGLGKAIANLFGENSFGDVIDSGLFAGLLAGLMVFVNNLNKPLTSLSGIFRDFKKGSENIVGILRNVRECFKAYQDQLKAGILVKIATAIGILAASIFVISTINPEILGKSLAAITVLFAELAGTMAIFTKIMPNLKGVLGTIPLILSMSTAMLILAAALKVIGSLKPEQMITGLVGVAGGMAILVGALHLMPEQSVNKASRAIRTLSVSLLILSGALKVMGSMSWSELGRGLAGMAGGLLAMVTAINLLPKDTALRSLGMVGLATSLVVLAGALKIMGSMSWSEIGRGLTALATSLVAIVAALRLMPKNTIIMGAGLMGIATALTILSGALKVMGSMSWESIGKGLTVLGGALLILSLGLIAMRNTIGGSAALLIASAALTTLSVVLKVLGGMSWESIAKGLIALAGALTIIGVAGAVLTPLIPSILALSGALALFGISAVAIGAGLMLIATGFTLLAASVAAGATAVVAGITVIITGLLDLIPTIASKMGEAIMTFAKVIGECSPQIAESVLKLISDLLIALAKYTPKIANSLFDLLIGILDVLATRMPELIAVTVKLINNFFVGVADALKNVDGANLLKGVIAVGIMTALAYALAGISGVVGPAMIGLLGVGALIAELALILAAIGALSQIPGLSWLVGEGGNLLQKIGTAIGQFVGGIVGGIAQGFTSSLPNIAADLSLFMDNVKPFIEGVKSIDASMLDGVKTLVSAILMITGADIVNSITSFITGGDSLSDFGKQLVPFGESMKKYGQAVAGVDSNAIKGSADAAKALAEVANAIPNSGGLVSLFAGDNNLSDFATQLVPFGTSLKAYSLAVSGINAQAIAGSAVAAKSLAEMANTIPNQGGIVAWFTGDNSLAKFSNELVSLGMGLKMFSVATTGVVPENMIGAANAAKSIAEMMNVIPNEGGLIAWLTGETSVSKFADKLPSLGEGLKGFSDSVAGISPENVTAAANAAKSLAQMADTTPKNTNKIVTFGENLVKFGGKLKSYFDKTSGITNEVVSAASKAIESVKTATNNLNASSISSASKAIDSLVESLKKMTEISESTVKGFTNAMKKLGETNVKTLIDTFTNAGPKLKDAGSNAIKKLIEGIESQQTATETACNKITKSISDCETSIKKYQTSFYNAGSHLVTGFVNGIDANSYKAAAKARAMALAAKNAAEKALGIKSPSKVFYKIGSFTGEGFINALKDRSQDVFNASKDMGDSARKGISGAIGKIADFFDSNETQPVIRPVLDLSNIEAGAGSISGMLNNVGIGANLKSISSSMYSRNQNGTNDDVVSAINKLSKNLGNTRGDTYNINGVSVDDETNIREAVQTIIRAAVVERRI